VTLTQKGRLAVITYRAERLRRRAEVIPPPSRLEGARSFAALELLHHQIEGYRAKILATDGEEALRRADRLAELRVRARDLDHQAERELVAGRWR
jgi:hypothetical protein